ncbi:MAG: NAD-dependent epimerase/dehydratase family protein [Longimicrobiales bacterium]
MQPARSKRVLVTGAGGFIGGHLVASLRRQGCQVRAVDRKPLCEWWQRFDDVENLSLDLSRREHADHVCRGMEEVYQLAADMGGIGFIERNKALCMLTVLITTNILMAARDAGAERLFYSSSACVYSTEKQDAIDSAALRENAAYPALPEDGYGWEKLFGERMCRHFTEDFGLTTRVARLHNVYGPHGSWKDGREKAPAAICRKVIEAARSNRKSIEIWGDGQQTRSFMYIDDCIEGIHRIMHSSVTEPINLGSSEVVTINQLVELAEEIAGIKLCREFVLDAPHGVRGRNSDNTMIRNALNWEPRYPLRAGLEKTYRWICGQYNATQE